MRRLALLPLVILAASLPGTAAPSRPAAKTPAKKPAATKPKTKPALAKPSSTKPVTRPVKGTTQLPGDNGQPGTTYTMGREGPVNFTLTGAEYRVQRVNIGELMYAPGVEEKLLVLHYTVHNPNPEATHYRFDTLNFMAVDSNSINHEYVQAVGKEGTTEALDMHLRPGQKVAAYTVLKVPAKGRVIKLMVSHYSGGAVLRFPEPKFIGALAAPYGDNDGLDARAEVTAERGQYYPLLGWDVRLDDLSLSMESPTPEVEKEENQQFAIATITLRNNSVDDIRLHPDLFNFTLVTSDDEKVEYNRYLLKKGRGESADANLKPGEQYTARIFFQIASDLKPKALLASEPESRSYLFNLAE